MTTNSEILVRRKLRVRQAPRPADGVEPADLFDLFSLLCGFGPPRHLAGFDATPSAPSRAARRPSGKVRARSPA